MSENTPSVPSVQSAPTNPAAAPSAITPVLFKGQPLPFVLKHNTRGKGAEKNAPLFIAAYAGSRPNSREVARFLELIGAENAAAAIDAAILRPLFTEASKAARVTDANGVMSIDQGKFVESVNTLLANFASNQTAAQQAQAELSKVEEEILAITREMFTAQLEGRQVDKAMLNKGNQLLLKQAELKGKLVKKPKAAAPTTVAATPAPAAAAAPAK